MPDARGRARLNLELPQELYDRSYRLIPWGWRNQLMIVLIDQLLDAIEKEGLTVAALIIDGKLKLFGKEEA